MNKRQHVDVFWSVGGFEVTLSAFVNPGCSALEWTLGRAPPLALSSGSLPPSPPGAAAITLLHTAVSSVCFDKIINLQIRTLKAWDLLEQTKAASEKLVHQKMLRDDVDRCFTVLPHSKV